MPVTSYDKRGDCCGRQPKEGEIIHPDLSTDETAWPLWRHVGFRVEAMAQLLSPNCPADLRDSLYFAEAKRGWNNDGALVNYIRGKAHVARLTRDHGYECVGWPVVRRCVNGLITISDGTHRLATMRALGRPAAGILVERTELQK